MRFYLISFLLYLWTLFFPVDSWWFVSSGNDKGCPRRGSASPFYFGVTDLSCLNGKKKRSAPARGVWDYTHRFIYYRGYYFEFFVGSFTRIGSSRLAGSRCRGGIERSPAGYSYLSLDCIKRCARRYRYKYGLYNVVLNNCHNFANRMSEVLCRRGYQCPSWCN
ncbi:uncharacterized protein LOC133183422 [Saccostrea echinata]|uniref:uncharacterized protein LOC133183422 n=1 Tax=Saccostrea echinata TaxID=191078 RepID=UPI002A7EDE24|nr:uncharacterized protein LOC133183422 [Saccostrea echinata]